MKARHVAALLLQVLAVDLASNGYLSRTIGNAVNATLNDPEVRVLIKQELIIISKALDRDKGGRGC